MGAIQMAQRAVDMIPEDNPERALLLGSLGTKLSYRYLRTGEAQDLEKALGLVQEAIELTPDANSDRASFLSNLGGGCSKASTHGQEM